MKKEWTGKGLALVLTAAVAVSAVPAAASADAGNGRGGGQAKAAGSKGSSAGKNNKDNSAEKGGQKGTSDNKGSGKGTSNSRNSEKGNPENKGGGKGNSTGTDGQQSVHIHQTQNIGKNKDSVTIFVGDKEYTGTIQGGSLVVDMDILLNGFDFGQGESLTIRYKNNTTGAEGSMALAHQEGNGTNIQNGIDVGLNNFKVTGEGDIESETPLDGGETPPDGGETPFDGGETLPDGSETSSGNKEDASVSADKEMNHAKSDTLEEYIVDENIPLETVTIGEKELWAEDDVIIAEDQIPQTDDRTNAAGPLAAMCASLAGILMLRKGKTD